MTNSTTNTVDIAGVSAAIESLRSMMQLDGGDLVVTSADADQVMVKLVLEDVECLDCVMKRPTIESLLLSSVREPFPSVSRVVLDDPRDGV